jgi:hypothetical protein
MYWTRFDGFGLPDCWVGGGKIPDPLPTIITDNRDPPFELVGHHAPRSCGSNASQAVPAIYDATEQQARHGRCPQGPPLPLVVEVPFDVTP